MEEYIKKDDALAFPFADGQYDHENADEHFIFGCETYREWLEQIPAADVRPVVDVEEAVDEAIRILNAINSSGRMDYEDYSKLHDAICTISPNCGADMRGET